MSNIGLTEAECEEIKQERLAKRIEALEKDSHPPVDIERKCFELLKRFNLIPKDSVLGD